MLNTTNSDARHPALEQSQRMFHRVLSSWAIDLVALRASGLDRPSARAGLWSFSIHQDSYQQIRKAA
ncbi:MAG: hypothetical protein ED559_09460 [Phycisphaera sp.]|nr:MAG: hypothetical protein ED559_09460 [Phycisphaera sp.]